MIHLPLWLAEVTDFILRVGPWIELLVNASRSRGKQALEVHSGCDQEIIISFQTPNRHADTQRSFNKGMDMETTRFA